RPRAALFPYTTLFRSDVDAAARGVAAGGVIAVATDRRVAGDDAVDDGERAVVEDAAAQRVPAGAAFASLAADREVAGDEAVTERSEEHSLNSSHLVIS